MMLCKPVVVHLAMVIVWYLLCWLYDDAILAELKKQYPNDTYQRSDILPTTFGTWFIVIVFTLLVTGLIQFLCNRQHMKAAWAVTVIYDVVPLSFLVIILLTLPMMSQYDSSGNKVK